MDKIEIKGVESVAAMREAGALAREALEVAGRLVAPGVTTEALDAAVYEFIVARGAYPSPLGYMGFPKSVCTSVNDIVAHGIPDDRELEEGDIVNVDVTIYINGHHGDTSSMFLAGRPLKSGVQLCEAARRGMDAGIAVCGPGTDFREVGKAISAVAAEANCRCSNMFCGHGIGSYFHGMPDVIPIVNDKDWGPMKPGMTFTIEPIFVNGPGKDNDFTQWDDDWTLQTTSGSWTAQFEHTILITESGHELLTGPSIDYRALNIAATRAKAASVEAAGAEQAAPQARKRPARGGFA